MVDHQLLCANQYGFTITDVAFIRSYLSQRMQCVWVNEISSECAPVGPGVVQGSVLGPLLFFFFINDIVNQISFCSYHLYANDVQLYISSRPVDFSKCPCERRPQSCPPVYSYQPTIHQLIKITGASSQSEYIL
jgi:hypothetical protein